MMPGAAIIVLAATAGAQQGLDYSATQLFELADQARAAGQLANAEAIYRALTADPDPEIRAEARFRLGMMLADQKRYTDAAVLFRALLDEKPDAARVRLELARILALMGDERAARRELRQVQAGGLPPEVSLVVDQFATALRSRKTLGGSFEIALAPDSNINRATDDTTLDTIIAPLELSEDARETSGLGVKLAGQGYARVALTPSLSLLPRLSGQAELYGKGAFNDISSSAQLGLEWAAGRDRIRPSIGTTWRWYGGDFYARTHSASVNWQHPVSKRAQLVLDGSVARADYKLNDLQDGWLYSLSASIERAFDARSGGSLTLSGLRQTARDPGYATASGGVGAVYWRDFGRTTGFVTADVRRLEGDARLFLFPERRKDWLLRATAGATFRQATLWGFAPVLRASVERNSSTVGLYDYSRVAMEAGVTRAF
ncbi:DUF560 domain-containing protein [Sphingomonas gilva]|uniref:DUF560 domain-containing protein n=1 Tax=Sphingomonas gilva TaxID=2305907 RepID=A0A396S3Z5_9SPHN|nr:surface lipoprotein assembly modifier [Sphingomonas gilva]RHW18135.1 DUF560 domain-containing protein [Sphingomonas gilva]